MASGDGLASASGKRKRLLLLGGNLYTGIEFDWWKDSLIPILDKKFPLFCSCILRHVEPNRNPIVSST